MDVTGLTPGKKYKFRVRALNKEGESEPLETSDAITAKNPFGKFYFIFFIMSAKLITVCKIKANIVILL